MPQAKGSGARQKPKRASARDRLHGTLDVLVLRTLMGGPRHGYGISTWLRDISEGAVEVEEGSLYPALHRLERDGLLEAVWGETDSGRRARFYRLTTKGRRHLAEETERFASFVRAVMPILQPAGA